MRLGQTSFFRAPRADARAAMMPRASCGNGAKSNFIDHFELLREQAKVSVTCSVLCPLLADWPHTPRPPQSDYHLGQSARPIARGPVDSLAAGVGLRINSGVCLANSVRPN